MDNGQTAFVTGGAEGIGAAVSSALLEEGYSVYFCDIDQAKGNARLNLLNRKHGKAFFVHLDVRDDSGWKSVAQTLKRNGVSIDVLVNNAGISDPFMEFPYGGTDQWTRILDTNLSSMFYSSNHLLPLMNQGSCIINIASTRAYQSEGNTLPYSASKGGVVALTHSLAVTLSGRGIRVNSVSPGWIDTSAWHIPPGTTEFNRLDHRQHPSGRIGKPEDVANLVVFLASEKGEWINGQDIIIDGGMSRRMIYFDREVMEDALMLLTRDRKLASGLMSEAFEKKSNTEIKK